MRPGPVIFLPPGAGPKQALPPLYCISNKELRRLAPYDAQSNLYVPAQDPYLCRDVVLSTARLGILI